MVRIPILRWTTPTRSPDARPPALVYLRLTVILLARLLLLGPLGCHRDRDCCWLLLVDGRVLVLLGLHHLLLVLLLLIKRHVLLVLDPPARAAKRRGNERVRQTSTLLFCVTLSTGPPWPVVPPLQVKLTGGTAPGSFPAAWQRPASGPGPFFPQSSSPSLSTFAADNKVYSNQLDVKLKITPDTERILAAGCW